MTGRRAALVACPLVAFLLYLPTLRHGFVFDDQAVIVSNPMMRDLASVPRLLASPYWNRPMEGARLYRPLTSLTFALDRAISGGRPAWFHLVNTLLHAAATLLVTLLALEILPGAAGALVAGLAFAVHPLHVEAVAGIVGRAEALAASGVLAACLAHRWSQRLAGRRAALATAAAWLATLAGVLAKESAVVAPLLCALGDLACPVTPRPPRRRLTALYSGYAAAFGLFALLRVAVLGGLGAGGSIPFIDNPAASAGPLAGRLTALGAAARYALLMLWPRHLSADYCFDQIPVVRSILDPWALAGLSLVLVVIGGGILLLRSAPAGAFALLWLAVSAAPASNLVTFIGTLLAERLMYLPSVGLCLLAGWAVARAGAGARGRAALVAALLACAALGARAWARLPEWRNDRALYESAAKVSPRCARIRYNLGNVRLRREEYAGAEEEYRLALAIYPAFNDARVNLGMALLQQGRANEALASLETAARERPGRADIAVDLGTAHQALGDDAAAEKEFRRALDLDPRSARAWNNLGGILLSRGDAAGAVLHLEKAAVLEPETAIYRINLADALVAAGRASEAVPQFAAASRLAPDLPEARRGLGEVALRRGDLAEAEREFRLALSGRPPSARAANFLGYIVAGRGDARGAAELYERAIELDPRLYDAHKSLGMLYARNLGDRERGARHLEASLRLAPDQPDAGSLRHLLKTLRGPGKGK